LDALLVLLVVYAAALLLKRATRLRGEPGQVCLATGLLLLPLLLTAWFASDGRPTTVLSPTAPPEAQQGWWWLTLKAEAAMPALPMGVPVDAPGGAPAAPAKRINLLAAAFWLTSLYIVITIITGLAADLTRRRGKPPWLAIHRALIKLPVLLIGGLVLAKVDLSTILVGTSVVVIGLGLVLRETLENLLTGLTLELEGSVRQGDWIQVGESGQIGRVYEKTWRAAKLETLCNESITIPNRLLGGERIMNLDRPQKEHARLLRIGASYEDPPIKVKDILETILIRDPEVLVKPDPIVRTVGYDDFAINYEMKFWIHDFRRRNDIEDRILTRIWYAFRFYKIQIPFPIRTVHMKEQDERESETRDAQATLAHRVGFLGALPIFTRLAPKELD